jgi:hypothetical protein
MVQSLGADAVQSLGADAVQDVRRHVVAPITQQTHYLCMSTTSDEETERSILKFLAV